MMKVLKFTVPGLLIFLLSLNVFRNWGEVQPYFSNLKIAFFIPAVLIMLLIYPQAAHAWALLLPHIKGKDAYLKAIRVWIISNTSRYIPGTIWQYIGRTQLAKKELKIDRKITALTIIAEVYLTLLAALCISAVTLPFVNIEIPMLGYLVLLSPLLLIFFHPKIIKILLSLIARATNRKIDFSFKLPFKKMFTTVFPLLIINFLINGLALFFLINSVTQMSGITNIISLTTFYALSWAIGFLSFFAPGGLGVTDASLAFLLTPSLGFSLASAVALLYRVNLTIIELITFIFFLKLPKKWIKQ